MKINEFIELLEKWSKGVDPEDRLRDYSIEVDCEKVIIKLNDINVDTFYISQNDSGDVIREDKDNPNNSGFIDQKKIREYLESI